MLKIDNDEIEAQVRSYAREAHGRVIPATGLENWVKANVDDSFKGRKKWDHFLRVWRHYSTSTTNEVVLDLGCGTGSIVFNALADGYSAFGLEPESELMSFIKRKNKHYFDTDQLETECPHFIQGVGEQIPLKDNSVAAIATFQALEHVENLQMVLSDCLRILKPGGLMFIVVPNYLSFYEGHYCITWFPLLPKWLAKIYLFFRNRNWHYISSINYTTLKRIVNCFSEKDVVIVDHNMRQFYQVFNKCIDDPDTIASLVKRLIYKTAKQLRMTNILKILERFLYQVLRCQLHLVVIKKPCYLEENTLGKIRLL